MQLIAKTRPVIRRRKPASESETIAVAIVIKKKPKDVAVHDPLVACTPEPLVPAEPLPRPRILDMEFARALARWAVREKYGHLSSE
jgi:hypothetical protein